MSFRFFFKSFKVNYLLLKLIYYETSDDDAMVHPVGVLQPECPKPELDITGPIPKS